MARKSHRSRHNPSGLVPRANPSEPRHNPPAMLDYSLSRERTTDVLYDAAKGALTAAVFVVAGTVLMRDSGFSAGGKAILIGAGSTLLGVGIRKSFPTPAFGLMVGGTMTMLLPLFDTVTGSVSKAFSPSGAVAQGNSVAQGYWDQRSSINSGTSVVVPL